MPLSTSALKGNKMPPKQVAQPACATPVRSAGLRSTFIQHIKDLHNLYEAGALSLDEFETQKTVMLKQMGDLWGIITQSIATLYNGRHIRFFLDFALIMCVCI